MHSKSLDLFTTYHLNIMKILMLIFGVVSSDGHLEFIKIPISNQIKDITCEKAIESNRKWQLNPNYTEGNGEVWGFYVYKNKPVVLHYCTEKGVDGE